MRECRNTPGAADLGGRRACIAAARMRAPPKVTSDMFQQRHSGQKACHLIRGIRRTTKRWPHARRHGECCCSARSHAFCRTLLLSPAAPVRPWQIHRTATSRWADAQSKDRGISTASPGCQNSMKLAMPPGEPHIHPRHHGKSPPLSN